MASTKEAGSLLEGVKCSVSSVLNRDVKQFGKQYLFDGNEETCWNSDQGDQQHIALQFPGAVVVSEIGLCFQGGFVGKECRLEGRSIASGVTISLCDFFPENINSVQKFDVECPEPIDRLRVIFSSSTDFFGRITVYQLDVRGTVSS